MTPAMPSTAPKRSNLDSDSARPPAFRPTAVIRPTTGRVRESILGRLTPYLPDARVLDGYAGSGLMGFECLSRGAASVWSIEKSPKHAHFIRQNAEKLGLWHLPEPVYRLSVGDIQAFIKHDAGKQSAENAPVSVEQPPFDIIYLDPPYHDAHITTVVTRLLQTPWLARGGVLLVEQGVRHDFLSSVEPPVETFRTDRWVYGETCVFAYFKVA
jgi:16S rRNA (guanine966-N2)-methyltransferase